MQRLTCAESSARTAPGTCAPLLPPLPPLCYLPSLLSFANYQRCTPTPSSTCTVVLIPVSSWHSAFTLYEHASIGWNDTSKLAAWPGAMEAAAGSMPNGASSFQVNPTGMSPVFLTTKERLTCSLVGTNPKSSWLATYK